MTVTMATVAMAEIVQMVGAAVEMPTTQEQQSQQQQQLQEQQQQLQLHRVEVAVTLVMVAVVGIVQMVGVAVEMPTTPHRHPSQVQVSFFGLRHSSHTHPSSRVSPVRTGIAGNAFSYLLAQPSSPASKPPTPLP